MDITQDLDTSEVDFLLEVTRFTPGPVSESYAIESIVDLEDVADHFREEATLVLGLACEDGAGGAFFLFIAEGRACIHLTQGACWTAGAPELTRREEPLHFRMDNGETLLVVPEQTVSRESGLQALSRWFTSGERMEGIAWKRL